MAARLTHLADMANDMRNTLRPTAEHQEWLFSALGVLERAVGKDSLYYRGFVGLDWGGQEPVSPYATFGTINPERRAYVQRFIADKQKAIGILRAAAAELQEQAANPLDSPAWSPSPKKELFLIHGHDDANLLRLEKLLRERWHLPFRVLADQANRGRTLIEKFEEEATECSSCFAIFTPDDVVSDEGAQARPNVSFELGWFAGVRGRQNCCILLKKGTKIHSDLDGVGRIEFRESVEEKIVDIERELTAMGFDLVRLS